ncbi:MAG TPA: aldehyde dehydrogenase family protein [Streptosporangiaceae bacterium]|nr:aldehyde dehydrogenase family protein [Streptosporangiaceae bacterium]
MAPENVSHYIGGRQVRSALLKTFGVADPATGKEYAQVAVGIAGDINQAVLAAQDALQTGPWPEMRPLERAAVLTGIGDAIVARAGDIAEAEALGTGLPVTQGRERAVRAASYFRLAADLVTARAADEASQSPDELGCVVRRPAGVAGLITPWRTPFLAQARALAPALAAGCTVVLKPDEGAPLPAVLLAEITTAAGLPAGVLNIVHGSRHHRAPGTQARDALIAHPAVTRLWFEGDAGDGQQVMLDAAVHRKNLAAELTGTSPCLVFADADLEQATDAALFGAFALNGQRCTATSAILAQRPVYDDIVSRLAKRADHIRVGAPSDPSTEIGPLVDAEHYNSVSTSVRAAVRDGARMAAGGRRPAALPEGNYFEATVLSGVTPSMQIFAEHLYGPVLRVTPFETEEEAVSLASAFKDAPAAYIWTGDAQRAHRLAPALDAADTWVNSHNPQDLAAPSTGPGGAGPGIRRELGGIDFYTQSWAVHIAVDDSPVPRIGD